MEDSNVACMPALNLDMVAVMPEMTLVKVAFHVPCAMSAMRGVDSVKMHGNATHTAACL